MIELRVLGSLDLRRSDGAEIPGPLAQRKRLALLVYLAVARPNGFHRRDTLLGIFWPELDAAHARGALRNVLYFLRRHLGKRVLLSRGDEVGLDGNLVWTDVAAFEAALRERDLDRAVHLYRGTLLEGFYLSDAPEFEHWVDAERGRLRDLAVDAYWAQAAKAENESNPAAALRWARRAVALRGDEMYVRRLIGLLARIGNRTEALREYEALAARVREEYEIELSPETLELARSIRAGEEGITSSAGRQAMPSGPRAGPTPETNVPETSEAAPDRGAAALEAAVPSPRGKRGLIRAGWGAAALAAVLALVFLIASSADSELDPNRVAVIPFDVVGPEHAWLGEGLMDMLAEVLDGAGPLRTVSPSVVARRWSGRADRASAAVLGRQFTAGLALFGRIVNAGPDSVRLSATLLDVSNARPLAVIPELRASPSRPDRLADTVAVLLLAELGRRRQLGTVKLSSLGSSSPTAIKAFLRGEQHWRRAQWDSAAAHYDAAIRADSTFPLPYIRMVDALDWNRSLNLRGGFAESRFYAARAGDLNRGLAPRESLLIAAESEWAAFPLNSFIGDSATRSRLQRWLTTFATAARLYPSAPFVWKELGEIRFHFGWALGIDAREANAAFARAVEVDPGFGPAYQHLMEYRFNVEGLTTGPGSIAAYIDSAAPQDQGARWVYELLKAPPRRHAEIQDRLPAVLPLGQVGAIFTHMQDTLDWSVTIARVRREVAPDTVFQRLALSAHLLHRGRLREAAALVDPRRDVSRPRLATRLFSELAHIGWLPRDSAAQAFREWLQAENDVAIYRVLPWWSVNRDTLSLARAVAGWSRRPTASPDATGGRVRYYRDAGRAYLTLARGDSSAAIRFLRALPPQPCADCFQERHSLARLLMATGDDREAASLLAVDPYHRDRLPDASWTIWTLERARVNERLGDRQRAVADYSYVAAVWHNADHSLQHYVREARAGLARLTSKPEP